MHIVLFGLLLPIVEVLKNGGNVMEFLGFKRVSQMNTFQPSMEEDDDVKKERSNVHSYLNDGYQSKVSQILFDLI